MIVRGRAEESVCYYRIEGECLLLEKKGIETVIIGYRGSAYYNKIEEERLL